MGEFFFLVKKTTIQNNQIFHICTSITIWIDCEKPLTDKQGVGIYCDTDQVSLK